MEYQVADASISPAELEADSRWVGAVKAHRTAAAHHPIVSPPPASPPSKTPCTTTLRRRLPAEDFKIVYRPGGGLDLRTTTNGALLQILCTHATIDYATARTADRVQIIHGAFQIHLHHLRRRFYPPLHHRLQLRGLPLPPVLPESRGLHEVLGSWPPRGCLHQAQVRPLSPLRPGPQASRAPDLRPLLHPVQGSPHHRLAPVRALVRPERLVIASSHLQAPASPTSATHRAHPQDLAAFPPPPPLSPVVPSLPAATLSFPPLPRSEASTSPATTSPVSWKPQPHTSDPQTAALEATIAAQQLQIPELSRQLQAALVRLSSSTPPLPSPAPAPPQPQ
nr:uncharacterized protein LOC126548356 [Dermacentor andersoni]